MIQMRKKPTPRYCSIDQALDWGHATLGARKTAELFRQVLCEGGLDESRPIRPQLARSLSLAIKAKGREQD